MLSAAGCSVLYDFDPAHLSRAGEAGAVEAGVSEAGVSEAGVTDASASDAPAPDAVTCPGADLARDDLNCGACGVRCGSSQRCRDGVCMCNGGGGGGGPSACGAECVNLNNSPRHCGACEVACGGATPECCSGSCRARCGQ